MMSLNSTVNPQIEDSWKEILSDAFGTKKFSSLREFLIEEKKNHEVYPSGKLIFSAFNTTPFHKVKVVILGQDPYHGPGQAHGMCFSVPDGIKPPPSLVNIFKELHADLEIPIPSNGNLEKWAKQGVLLLNATLTVRARQAGSHQGKGWEEFTNTVITELSDRQTNLVFILWGRFAQAKESLIDSNKHLILKASHPSPFSAYNGFFGCAHFSKTNEYLSSHKKSIVDWNLNTD